MKYCTSLGLTLLICKMGTAKKTPGTIQQALSKDAFFSPHVCFLALRKQGGSDTCCNPLAQVRRLRLREGEKLSAEHTARWREGTSSRHHCWVGSLWQVFRASPLPPTDTDGPPGLALQLGPPLSSCGDVEVIHTVPHTPLRNGHHMPLYCGNHRLQTSASDQIKTEGEGESPPPTQAPLR